MLIDGWKPIFGGGQNHVWEICKRLVEDHDCMIDLYVRSLKDKDGKKFNKNERYFGGKLKIIRVGPAFRFYNVFGRICYIFLTPFCIKDEYDIIHAHAYLSAFPAKILKFLIKKPVVLTVHGTGSHIMDELSSNKVGCIIKKFVEDLILFKMKYDLEITVSRDFMRFNNLNMPYYIPNGVNIKDFDKTVIKKDPGCFKLIFVGRFCKQKGLIYLFKAMKSVVKKDKNIKLYMVGDGEDKEMLQNYIKNNNLKNNIIFCGKLFGSELIKEYKTSHLFVLPSIFEGQPLTILEAWAAKLPVLVTSVGDNPYIIKEGINGFLIKSKDEDILSKMIIKASKMNNLKKLGLEGYKELRKNFTWRLVANKLFKKYEELLKK